MKALKWAVIYWGHEGTRPEIMEVWNQKEDAVAKAKSECERTGLNGLTNPNFYSVRPVSVEVLEE